MKSLWRIITFTRELWRYYAGISFLTVLIAILSQLTPLFTKGAVDEVTNLIGGGQANTKLVFIFAVSIFLTEATVTLVSNLSGYYGDLLSVKVQKLMSLRYYDHLLQLPQSYYDTELSGKIINRMSRGINQISTFVQIVSNNFLQFIFSTIFTLSIVAYFSWQVALMLFVLYPVFFWLTARTSVKWQQYQQEINTNQDIATGRFAESVNQMRVVKSFGRQASELRHFDKQYTKAVALTRPQSKLWHKQDVVRRLVMNVISLGIYAYIFVGAANGTYSIGTMVLLIQYVQLIRIPMFTISYLVDQTQRAISNTTDYFEVIDQPVDSEEAGKIELQIKRGGIRFDQVTFAYEPSAEKVLHKLSFEVEPDTKVALIGESGEGKTTITSLLLRLYQVQSGSIYIDGQDIATVTSKSLHNAISVVFQEPALFSGTIEENIAYGKEHATEEEIIAAAKAANAHEFIAKFTEGYKSEIGERGLKLSGGQKQRIAIARAILKDAPLLILDEATSSLDSKSELLVQEALEKLMKGRTVIVIAHRLSTVQSMDKIIAIKGGKVLEQGPPDKLARTTGIYASLLKLQKLDNQTAKKKLQNYEISS